jgi:hypothetical protein
VSERGTAVRLSPRAGALSPLLDPGFVDVVLRRQFAPFFDPALADILAQHYPRGVGFTLNEQALEASPRAGDAAPIAVRLGRRRKPAGVGYLVRELTPLPDDERGLAISTYGKVIKRGWDWLGLAPAAAEHVRGIVEVPALAECLTLNKADFIRSGSRGAIYLAYRKALQEAVTNQVAARGDAPAADERARRRAARPVERDLESVLTDLADDFPLLATLVEQRAGGQRRLATAGPERNGAPIAMTVGAAELQQPEPGAPEPVAAVPTDAEPTEAAATEAALPDAAASEPVQIPEPAPANGTGPGSSHVATGSRTRRPMRYGLGIQFEARPDDPELGRLVESTVWINESHPAYRRAVASRAEGYHVALAVAMALAPLAVEPVKEHGFVTTFLARWGDAIDRRKERRRR